MAIHGSLSNSHLTPIWSFIQELAHLKKSRKIVVGSDIRRLSGVSNLLASLGHTEKRGFVWGHTLNTLQHVITKISHYVLSKFTILCWAIFPAILSHMWPAGHRLETPDRAKPGFVTLGRSQVLFEPKFSHP